MVRESCIDQFDAIGCGAASNFCSGMLSAPFRESGRWSTLALEVIDFSIWFLCTFALIIGTNPYDISVPCNGSVATTLCYPVTAYVRCHILSPHLTNPLSSLWDVLDTCC